MIFVSYTGVDEPWATWVAEELEAAGASVKVQAWDSPAGVNFVTWISEQMVASERTVAICSPAYFVSERHLAIDLRRLGDIAGAERLEKLTEDRTRPD